jgi:N-acetylglucosamine kinase-like BadF-type ATPase
MSVAGVDVGGSGVRVRVVGHDFDRHLQRAIAQPRLEGRVDVPGLAALIVESVLDAADCSVDEAPDVLCIGMAGLPDLLDEPEQLASLVADALRARRVVLSGDAATAHVGAFDFGPGTVVAAGTGVVALGTDWRETWTRSDGWGLLLGDEGGGAWVGRQGLVAALRSMDGRRGGSVELLERMHARFGPTQTVVDAVYGNASPAHLLGRFAPDVAAAASAGDPVALGIWSQAGRHLAAAAIAASVDVEPVFSWTGRLFDAGHLVLHPYQEAVSAARPSATFVAPFGSPADGALQIARLSAQHDSFASAPVFRVFDSPLTGTGS